MTRLQRIALLLVVLLAVFVLSEVRLDEGGDKNLSATPGVPTLWDPPARTPITRFGTSTPRLEAHIRCVGEPG